MEVAIYDPDRICGSKDNSPDLGKGVNGTFRVDGDEAGADRIEET